MTSGSKSREHHWWPVGLQKYWQDKYGDLSWIEPDGKIKKKRVKKRKIASKSHGHTFLRGGVWERNFEDEFAPSDDSAPKVVEALLRLKPLGRTPTEFLSLMRLFLRRDRHLRDLCKYCDLDQDLRQSLLLVLFSLLIRSPGNRFRYENYPKIFSLPPDEDIGKVNMWQNYSIAKKLCEHGAISNQYFILIHTPFKRFIFGDGCLDWLTASLTAHRISGRALLPLTPNLCMYCCTPLFMQSTPNCASFCAAPWMVDWINEIVQIYSRDKLFFVGKPPVLTEAFRKRQFLEHEQRTDELIEMLDEVAGNKSRGIVGFGANL